MKWLLVIALVVSACGGATQPSTPQSSGSILPLASIAVAAPSPAAPSQSPDPEAVRRTAAKAYLAAATAFNKAVKPIVKKYQTFGTLKRARAYYKAIGQLEGEFIARIKVIPVPADTEADLHALVAKVAAVQALYVEGSKVKTWAQVDSVARAITKADRASVAASNLIRVDLGLPPVGS